MDNIEKIDLRILKTRRAIKEAFLALMYKDGFEAVTVQQILNGALVNRSTFYAHYRDKYDLRDRIEDELVDELAERAMESIPRGGAPAGKGKAIRAYLDAMLDCLLENKELVSHLLGPGGDPAFVAKLSARTHDVWGESGLLDRLALPERYVFAGLSGMVSGVLSEWARSGFEEGKSEVSDVLIVLLAPVAQSVMR